MLCFPTASYSFTLASVLHSSTLLLCISPYRHVSLYCNILRLTDLNLMLFPVIPCLYSVLLRRLTLFLPLSLYVHFNDLRFMLFPPCNFISLLTDLSLVLFLPINLYSMLLTWVLCCSSLSTYIPCYWPESCVVPEYCVVPPCQLTFHVTDLSLVLFLPVNLHFMLLTWVLCFPPCRLTFHVTNVLSEPYGYLELKKHIYEKVCGI
jgi:hypothetical protein